MSNTGSVPTPEIAEPKKRFGLADLLRRLVKEKPLGTVGGVIVLAMLFTGIFAEIVAPYPMEEIHLADSLQPPSSQYLLGTDLYGRDLLSRVIFGARISVVVGLSVSFFSVLVSTAFGITSGFIGGKFDLAMQRFVDAWMCFPSLFIILTIMSVLGPGMLQVIVVLSLQFGIVGSRVVRSAVISIKENVYIDAARVVGCSLPRILMRHVLPNIMGPIVILVVMRVGSAILNEATISFLGYGIPPPTPSWGGMLGGIGRKFMITAPWLALWPGVALSLVVFGVNLFGDALRDLLDPRLRGGAGRYGGTKMKRRLRSESERNKLSKK